MARRLTRNSPGPAPRTSRPVRVSTVNGCGPTCCRQRRSFDTAFVLDLDDGSRGLIAVDVKYHERTKAEIPRPENTWGRYVVVHPAGNSDVVDLCTRYGALLADESTFATVPLEQLLDTGHPSEAHDRRATRPLSRGVVPLRLCGRENMQRKAEIAPTDAAWARKYAVEGRSRAR
jgi:hypothetical protein